MGMEGNIKKPLEGVKVGTKFRDIENGNIFEIESIHLDKESGQVRYDFKGAETNAAGFVLSERFEELLEKGRYIIE